MTTELKPCDLCGKTPWVTVAATGSGRYWVECIDHPAEDNEVTFETEAEAVAAWNRRHP